LRIVIIVIVNSSNSNGNTSMTPMSLNVKLGRCVIVECVLLHANVKYAR